MTIRRALISVYDKTGIVDFARALHEEFGIEIISTGGTAKTLRDAGIPVTLIEAITGFPEMLDGRVKTLHPAIHAGILADRDNPEHMRQLEAAGIKPIDMVVVNLYPFEKTVADPNCTFEQAIEMIDIGGVTLLRAAAKNHKHVVVISNAIWNDQVLDAMRGTHAFSLPELRRELANFTFVTTRRYDQRIWDYLSSSAGGRGPADLNLEQFASSYFLAIFRDRLLRYGENPHQESAVYSGLTNGPLLAESSLHNTADCSFNNYVDADAALGLCAELAREGSAKLYFAPSRSEASAPGPEHAGHTPVKDELTYRRKLPHWQLAGATYFVTFSTASGELNPAERDAVLEALRYWDGKKLDLHVAVVMRDHVHLLLTPRKLNDNQPECHNLSELLQSIKANSSRAINKLRGDSGQIWLSESYDRWMRSPEEFFEKWKYIANNPVKEGLAATPDAYRWFYANETLDPFNLQDKQQASEKEKPRGSAPDGGKPALAAGDEENLRRTSPTAPRVCCFIKHTNACGVGIADTAVEAYRRAYLGDPNAAMGGILACNFEVDAEFAAAVMETYDRFGKPLKEAGAAFAPGGFFVEVWIAPSFSDEALAIIRGQTESGPKKKWGENVRLLAVGDMSRPPDATALQYRSIAGGMLVQTPDVLGLNEEQWKVVTKRQPTESEMADLRLAWLIAKHTKSNAISICKNGMLIGNGAGQMSRVMSCRIATWLARENGHAEKLAGSSAASDAFFPFSDGPKILLDAGVTALIQPGGSKRDEDTIKLCDERGVAMIFTGTRHFRH